MKMRFKIALMTLAASAITTVFQSGCNLGQFLGDLVGDAIFLRGVD